MSGIKGLGADDAKSKLKNQDKFLKTQKKLPDLKMGNSEGGVNPKNMTFSSDSEDPNLVRILKISFLEATADDQRRRTDKQLDTRSVQRRS